jgi:hypothetical protein
VRAALEAAEFRIDELDQVALRTELGRHVQGLLAVATRRDASGTSLGSGSAEAQS